MIKKHNFTVIIEQDEDWYFAKIPEIQGCYAQWETYEEVMLNLKDVLSLCIKEMTPFEKANLKNNKTINFTTLEYQI